MMMTAKYMCQDYSHTVGLSPILVPRTPRRNTGHISQHSAFNREIRGYKLTAEEKRLICLNCDAIADNLLPCNHSLAHNTSEESKTLSLTRRLYLCMVLLQIRNLRPQGLWLPLASRPLFAELSPTTRLLGYINYAKAEWYGIWSQITGCGRIRA